MLRVVHVGMSRIHAIFGCRLSSLGSMQHRYRALSDKAKVALTELGLLRYVHRLCRALLPHT